MWGHSLFMIFDWSVRTHVFGCSSISNSLLANERSTRMHFYLYDRPFIFVIFSGFFFSCSASGTFTFAGIYPQLFIRFPSDLRCRVFSVPAIFPLHFFYFSSPFSTYSSSPFSIVNLL